MSLTDVAFIIFMAAIIGSLFLLLMLNIWEKEKPSMEKEEYIYEFKPTHNEAEVEKFLCYLSNRINICTDYEFDHCYPKDCCVNEQILYKLVLGIKQTKYSEPVDLIIMPGDKVRIKEKEIYINDSKLLFFEKKNLTGEKEFIFKPVSNFFEANDLLSKLVEFISKNTEYLVNYRCKSIALDYDREHNKILAEIILMHSNEKTELEIRTGDKIDIKDGNIYVNDCLAVPWFQEPEEKSENSSEFDDAYKAKSDKGKPKLSLVPRKIIFDIAKVREYGNSKYPEGGPDNWKQVGKERYRDAAFRHFMAYLDDPTGADEESGLPHLSHLACNVAFLCELEDFKQ